MDVSMIFCYKTDDAGNYIEGDDLLDVFAFNRHYTVAEAIEADLVAPLIEELDDGYNLRFELLNLDYRGEVDSSDVEAVQALLDNLTDNLSDLLDAQMVSLVDDDYYTAKI